MSQHIAQWGLIGRSCGPMGSNRRIIYQIQLEPQVRHIIMSHARLGVCSAAAARRARGD